MSWLRIEGKMPNHEKVSALSDAAFRLHVSAMAWSVEFESDGRLAAHIPETLPKAPRTRALLARALSELTSADLWERGDDGAYVIHDFLKYNPSSAQSKAVREQKTAAGAAGGRAKADNGHGRKLAAASYPSNDLPSEPLAEDKRNPSSRAGPRAQSDSDSEPREEKIPLPPSEPEQTRAPPSDPFGATFGKNPPGKRADVLRVWEAFKRALAFPRKTKLGLGRPWDPDAQRIADAIDAYDEATCVAVAAEASFDGMVNGTQDERGVKHDTVAYVFENPNTFSRLLRAAEAKKKRNSGIDVLSRAANAEPDLSNYRDPEVA